MTSKNKEKESGEAFLKLKSRDRIGWTAILAVTAFLVLIELPAFAQLPQEVVLGRAGVGSDNYSASTNGDVFAIKREIEGKALISMPNQTFDLTAFSPDDVPVDAPKNLWGIKIAADGKYAFQFARGRVAIHSLPDASLVWSGMLGTNTRPYVGKSYYYRPTEKQILFMDGRHLLTYALVDNGPAKFIGAKDLSFSQSKASRSFDFIPTAVFTEDGRTLFAGTQDGDVLAIDVSGMNPRLQWRLNVFQEFTLGSFEDHEAAYISCAEGCQKLIVRSSRGIQLALVDTKTVKILKKLVSDQRLNMVGVGNGQFAMTKSLSVGGGLEFSLVNSMLEPLSPVTVTRDILLFGREGGYVVGLLFGDKSAKVAFRDVGYEAAEARRRREAEVAELKKRQEAEVAEERRQAQQKIDDAEADRQRKLVMIAEARRRQEAEVADLKKRQEAEVAQAKQEAIEAEAERKELIRFRGRLKSGDDSNCGLVIERKGDIAQVETMIGPKWVRVAQLYLPGMRRCTFVNGVLQQ